MATCLNLSRHPSMGHVASLHLCRDVFHQLGTSSPIQQSMVGCLMFFQDCMTRSKQGPWPYSAGNHSSSHQKHARWDILMSFQATRHPLHCVACRIKQQVRRQVAPPAISISRLKNNDCAATLWAVIKTVRVKGLSQPRCDKAPDAIKASHNSMGRER